MATSSDVRAKAEVFDWEVAIFRTRFAAYKHWRRSNQIDLG